MANGNEIKAKADKLIEIVNLQAVSSVDAFLTRFPEIEMMMENKSTDDWIFYMTIGGTAAAVMSNRQLTGIESTEIVQSLSNWNRDATEGLNDLLGFIDKNSKSGSGDDPFSALGLWVLKNVKKEQPSTEEATLASVIGIFLRDSFKGAWGSN